MNRALAAAAGWLMAWPLYAASTQVWEMNTYEDFVKGRFSGVALSRDGRLRLAPRLDPVFSAGEPAVWSVARAADGTLYLGTGHKGRVYRAGASGTAELLWTADEPEVFAIALDARGVLYAATSPNGKVYRIENGAAAEYYAPGATYIWSLVFGGDGALYVGTSDNGKIHRVEGPGKGDVYYDTGQSHVTSLAVDREGRLLAGTEPNGILYRITGKDKAFVLYDANFPEIRAIVPAGDGGIYAAALGGSLIRQVTAAGVATALPPAGAATVTSITVTAAEADAEIKAKAEKAKPAPQAVAGAPVMAPPLEIPGVEKSGVYRIHPDNTIETLWTSTEENAYDVVPAGDKLLIATDAHGRVYELGPDRKVTLITQTGEAEATRLLHSGRETLVATSNMGKLYRLGEDATSTGTYEAPVHDAGSVARWGRLSWRLAGASGARAEFQTRSGNSARPDATWSDWSAPLTHADGSPVPSPNARYIQWKTTLGGGPNVEVDTVELAYLPQNTPPKVTSITVGTKAPEGAQAKPAQQPAAPATYSITVTDTGEAGASTASGTPTQRLQRLSSDQIEIAWQAEDADGDRLLYSLYFRGEGETAWKTLKRDLEEAKYTLDPDVLADGKYVFRVTASDRVANPPDLARESDYVSAPVLVDHSPPSVQASPPAIAGSSATVEIEARDTASALRRCEYSLNAGHWIPLAPVDGIIDSFSERFTLKLENLAPGEHLLVIRVYDSAENAGLAKVLINIR
ncbi:MAG: hypothetical protein KIT09_25765 [Bryobacteraceae bacterium]|nr:hypothetical protein [Bryobacteraceae bacterium]